MCGVAYKMKPKIKIDYDQMDELTMEEKLAWFVPVVVGGCGGMCWCESWKKKKEKRKKKKKKRKKKEKKMNPKFNSNQIMSWEWFVCVCQCDDGVVVCW